MPRIGERAVWSSYDLQRNQSVFVAEQAMICHKCAWDSRGMVRGPSARTVVGWIGPFHRYSISLDLCQVCEFLFDNDKAFEARCSVDAARAIARQGIGSIGF